MHSYGRIALPGKSWSGFILVLEDDNEQRTDIINGSNNKIRLKRCKNE